MKRQIREDKKRIVTGDRLIGRVYPLGVSAVGDNRLYISVWCPGASSCRLCIYEAGKLTEKIKMHPLDESGMNDIFSVMLEGERLLDEMNGKEYDFLADGKRIQDPYARAVAGRDRFGKQRGRIRGRFVFDEFDWKGEKWRKLPADEMILYQCHVRGFTKHASSGVAAPGTFSGVQEKIPYLKKLGVNTLLFLPAYDFNERMEEKDGGDGKKVNYWGYTGDAFYFAPKAGYCSGETSPAVEFQRLVRELHKSGMNLILDMYFSGQTPEFVLQCLRYYALEFHIDGFRVNQQDGVDINWLRTDPVLSHVKLLGLNWAEQQGTETDPDKKLYEMNDGFLVDARRYLKSDEGQTEIFYRRFKEQRQGVGVIHYIAQHNGFTMRDMISYDVKHNEANGERNEDGTEYNYSWNCGEEGHTRRKSVLRMRERQEKNAFVMLLLGMAAPMILAGDEFGNTQKGNNNAYCQDNVITWLNWGLLEKNRSTYEFVKRLIAFRKENPLYHRKKNLTGMDTKGLGIPDVSCHGREPWTVDFSHYSRELGILFEGSYFGGKSLYFVFNFHWDSHDFYLPEVKDGNQWRVLLDTAAADCDPEVVSGRYTMAPRSVTVFESICSRTPKRRPAAGAAKKPTGSRSDKTGI